MSLLFREQPLERAFVLPPGYGMAHRGYGRGSTPVYVDNDSSMTHSTVWACRVQIAQEVSMMPVDVVRYAGDTRQSVNPTPQIIVSPSLMVDDAMDWRYQILMSWSGYGNAWGIVTKTTPDFRYPLRIELKDQQTSIRFIKDGDRVRIFVDNIEEQLWPLGRLWHAPFYTMSGQLLGLSPIQYHAMTIGKGIAAETHGLQYFTDGAHPTSVWKLKGANSTQAQSFKDRLMSLARGNREPLTVDADAVEMVQLQSNPTDSQFIETEKWSALQICSIFGVFPESIGLDPGGLVYSNRSDFDLANYKKKQFVITKMQNILTAMLPRPQVVKLNTSALLMMTDMERHQLFDLRLKNKTMSVNAVHKLEDEPPVKDPIYDAPGIPGGSQPLGQTIKEITPGVGVMLTSDEARDILNENGADLPVPGPAFAAPTGPPVDTGAPA